MMETMIPPQVGMRLRTKNKEKERERKEKKRPIKMREGPNKKMREKREGEMLLSFYHTCASK